LRIVDCGLRIGLWITAGTHDRGIKGRWNAEVQSSR
jgi:hypothetical protein